MLFLLVACTAFASQASKAVQNNQPNAKETGPPTAEDFGDVDEVVPPVAADVPCSLPEVLRPASDRVRELVSILPEFTATERVDHREGDKSGKWRTQQTVTFNYLAEMEQVGPGMLHMMETRNGTTSPNVFPGGVADIGLPAIALVFHPFFIDEYSMACEGLGKWEGKPAWQIHFQQRPDRDARLRAYTVKNHSFPVKLKGRAWIAADSFQVVHIETDLLEPLPMIRLFREHLSIDYDPVQFQAKKTELWLPNTADVYMNYQGRIYHRRHTFSDFLLFSVDVEQKIAEPK